MATPLHAAVVMNDLEKVKRLLHTPGTEVDVVGERGTPLCYAAKYYRIEAAEVLIAAGADVNRTSTFCCGPLQVAALAGNKEMAILLLDSGADIESSSSIFSSPLIYACAAPHRDFIITLLDRGADVNKWNGQGPLHAAAASHDDADIIQLLLDAGAHVNAQGRLGQDGDERGDTPLHFAACFGNRKSTRALLAAKADPNLKRTMGECTVLDLVICYENAVPGIIEDLLSYGANVMHKNELISRTALQRLQFFHETDAATDTNMFSNYCQIASILVAAGDRNWGCVPVPCPGIERALLSVWKEAPEELSEVAKRLEVDLKENLHSCLRITHGRLPVDLRMRLLGAVLEK